jgi:tetratricopeptide (TPR) repeat protein
MPSHNDPVKPIPFDAVPSASTPTATAHTATAAASRDTSKRTLIVLAVLALLAMLVLFWLPSLVQQAPEPTAQQSPAAQSAEAKPSATAATNPAGPSTGQAPAGPDGSPWSDAQAARLRKQAQEVLAKLLDVQFALQERGVEQWAPAQFAEVKIIAADADALYKNREYEKAVARYQQGLTALQALQEGMPAELKRLLAQAQQALDAGDAAAATNALAMAAIIAPDNTEITVLKHRADVLPQVMPLLQSAAGAEAAGDLAQAQQLLKQAATLDPQHQRAASELQRVTTEAAEQGFNAAMSEGYAALNEGRFDSARKSFSAAAKLQPASGEAASALKEVHAAETARQLASLDKQGRQNEQQEQWQKAVTAYEQAQKLDGSVLFASEGLNRSRARAELDQKLRMAIDDPTRLADTAVAAATAQLLAQAKQVTPRGPVLEQQITRLETLLGKANTTVAVTLHSDQQTEVTLYKVAKLGRFAEHELALRPGTYTALGTRIGYRDVRQSFTITAEHTPAPVTIICTDPI